MQTPNVSSTAAAGNSLLGVGGESANNVLLEMFFVMQDNMNSISAAANTIVNSIKDTNKKSSDAQAKANAVQDAINSLDPNNPSATTTIPPDVITYMRDNNIMIATKDGDKTIDQFMGSKTQFNAAELKTVKAAIDRVVTDLTNQSSTTNLDSQRVSNALSQVLQACSQLLSIIKELVTKTIQNM